MSQDLAPYVILIRSGPMWKLEERLGFHAAALADRFDGEILTWSTAPGRLDKGRFEVIRFPVPYEKPLWARIIYILRLLRRALRARWRLGRRVVVITYDPFESGVVGLLMKWFVGATFVCELNGVYGHPMALADMEDRDAAGAKQERMLRFGAFVLERCDAIKLLYPEQMIGFPRKDGYPPSFAFHDIVNTPLFEPRGLEPEKRLLLVGTPFRLKGVDLLLEAFARVANDFPEWELHLVGWQLEEPAGDLSFPRDRVHFPGPLPAGEVAEIMERSAIFVLPSRSEAMGRVLLEAAFIGRPRIGSRVGGIPYVIEDGVDGLLVDACDVDALERSLRLLMGDESLRRKMGREARRRAMERFTIREYVRRYEDLITSVVP